MNKLLYIVGPTATGKTSLAISISKIIDSQILSADSRQVYKFMDIGTGKDIPKGFFKHQESINNNEYIVYKNSTTSIWGYDVVNPDQEFSISHFYHHSKNILSKITHDNHLPIVVGGTGLYLKSIETPPTSISIPQDKKLRHKLSKHSLIELQNELKKINIDKFKSFNHSDANNPRRLIRAIEISNHSQNALYKKSSPPKYDSLWVGLRSKLETIDNKIEARVHQRIHNGFEKEFESLYAKKLIKNHFQSSSSTGYKQWIEYKNNQISKKEAIDKWIRAEKQYARRQITWFNKQKNIKWFDIDSNNYPKSVVETVKVWYS